MTLHQLFESFSEGAKWPLLIVAASMAPLVIVGTILHRRKMRYKAEATEPFTRLPLRPAGESLRIKIDELAERLDEAILTLCALNIISAVVTATALPGKRIFTGGFLGILVLIGYVFYLPRILRTVRKLWDYRLGYKGERLVGEELNQLGAVGFRVFHDLPFDGFNIDHVLVGPPGVYAIETKTRRKPTKVSGREKATIVFDGDQLHFPSWSDSKAIEQARRNAKTLSNWLSSAVGEPIAVKAILTIPGWWIQRKARSDVNVLNPDEIKRSFPNQSSESLTAKQIQQVVHQLTERSRSSAESGKL